MTRSIGTELSGPGRWHPGTSQHEEFDPRGFEHSLDLMLAGEIQPSFHYQPIVDLRRGVVAGYEALARFPASMGHSPAVCFAAASAAGKRLALEATLIRSALRSRELLPSDTFLTVNISPAVLLSHHWDGVLDSNPNLTNVVIEVTEEESITDYVRIRERLDKIRSLGGCLAVDDAGAGFASLQHIIEMKPAFIKLDRALVKDCHADRAKSVLIEMIGRAGSRLDAWIIAEGIENQHELEELTQLGAPLGQGFYLGRPHPTMQPLATGPTETLRALNRQRLSSDRLAPHVESCPARATSEEVQFLLKTRKAATVVLLDSWDRPVQIFERHPVLGLRCLTSLMKSQIASDPAEVLQRALTRPAENRFDPFAVISSEGIFQGIVHVDRLMSALLEASPIQH
jgi:EAL domain-containing protein (putative c-di-GMP-specific phosphodiesterase class I)